MSRLNRFLDATADYLEALAEEAKKNPPPPPKPKPKRETHIFTKIFLIVFLIILFLGLLGSS